MARRDASARSMTARQLRRRSTSTEEALWDALRGRRCGGAKFRRQHPLGRFVVDFYSAAHRLIVEVDGAAHDGREDFDEARQQQLELLGNTVLRFRAEEIETGLPRVLALIRQALASATQEGR